LKPLGLSGSRGVIRVDTVEEFWRALARIRALLARPQIRAARAGLEDAVLVEEFIPGREFAIEGVMTAGALTVFAVFDKPDPLDGPFFEETIYVTPPRLADADHREIVSRVGQAAAALGLAHGPIHAECRVNENGVYVLEVAARPIGGLCSRVLTFVGRNDERGSLERVLLEHAAGQPISDWGREARAAAVMMIPIPRRGLLKGVWGEAGARAVPGIVDLRITAKIDQLLEPLPEAGSYLGFIFSRGETSDQAERAVRDAHAALSFEIQKEIEIRQA
jgi:biotin carboxylase